MKYKLLCSFLGLISIILVGNQSVQAQQTIIPSNERLMNDSGESVCLPSNMRQNDIPKQTIKKVMEELTILPQNIPIKLPLLRCTFLSPISADNRVGGLAANIAEATRRVTELPENIAIDVPLGNNRPVRAGEAEAITPGEERSMFSEQRNLGGTLENETITDEVIGYIDTSGKAQPLTYAFIASLLKNWSNAGVQSKNPPILIVRDSQKNLTYFLPRSVNDINLENVLLHSLINFQIRRSNHDLSKLNINNWQK
jgi:hypothetical protein